MTIELKFHFDGDKLIIGGLPPHLQLRGIKLPSKSVAELKHVTIASANITAAKFYMDSIKTATKDTDAHMYDAALLAAIVKYGSVFKLDSKGRSIDARRIFTNKLIVVNRSLNDTPMLIDDPELDYLKRHSRLVTLRDKMIAHDDRIVGNSECFAAFDDSLKCEHVVSLTQRTTVYSAIKSDLTALPICIDVVLTWLAGEKERYCQIVNDEINKLSISARQKFPEPTFERYVGLADAAERKANPQPQHWKYDWDTGKKEIVATTSDKKPTSPS
jgi:hypothetical protein